MGYFIVTYRVVLDGIEKFCGDAVMVSNDTTYDLKRLKIMVVNGYCETFPKACAIGITIIKTVEVDYQYVYNHYGYCNN